MNGNIWRVSAIRALSVSMCFPIPTLLGFWKMHGLSMTEIMLTQAFFAVAVVILEVPTGYLADRFTRRGMIILAAMMCLLGELWYSFGTGFWNFIQAEGLLAVGLSLLSGSDQALLHDTLAEGDREWEFGSIWGRARSWELWMSAGAFVVGGILGAIDLRWPFYAAVMGSAVFVVIAIGLVEPVRMEKAQNWLRDIQAIGKEAFIENRKLRWLTFFVAGCFVAQWVNLWLYQPYFELAGISTTWNGWIFSGFALVAGLFSRVASRIEKRIGAVATLGISAVGAVMTPILLSLWVVPSGVLLVLPQQLSRGLLMVSADHLRNSMVGSKYRSTHASLQSLVQRLWGAVTLVLLGGLSDYFGIRSALFLLGGGTGVILLWIWGRRPVR